MPSFSLSNSENRAYVVPAGTVKSWRVTPGPFESGALAGNVLSGSWATFPARLSAGMRPRISDPHVPS